MIENVQSRIAWLSPKGSWEPFRDYFLSDGLEAAML